MIDKEADNTTTREKAIKGLEHCDFGVSGTCYEKECPYYQSHDCTDELKNDILALLKKQKEIITCKDCKHKENGVLPLPHKDWCNLLEMYVAPNWFCAAWETQKGKN